MTDENKANEQNNEQFLQVPQKSLDLDKRSTIVNLCPWTISFTLPISNANILIGANKKTSINNQELVVLCENQNVMFVGTGNGNHARVYIENPELRKYVGFDLDSGKQKQFILTNEECKRILGYETFITFEKHLKKDVVSKHEMAIIMNYARKIKLNDYERVVVLENHCGMKFKKEENK
jgi:hypothetical protein